MNRRKYNFTGDSFDECVCVCVCVCVFWIAYRFDLLHLNSVRISRSWHCHLSAIYNSYKLQAMISEARSYLHRQVGVGTSGKPMWWNGSTLAQNTRDVGSIPTLGTIFPIFITTTTITMMMMMMLMKMEEKKKNIEKSRMFKSTPSQTNDVQNLHWPLPSLALG